MQSWSIENLDSVLLSTTHQLTKPLAPEAKMMPCGSGHFPSAEGLKQLVETVRTVIFPDFFDQQRANKKLRGYFIGVNVEKLYSELHREVARALRFDDVCCEDDAERQATEMALCFINHLPELKRVIYTDVEAVFKNDPAVGDYGEIVLCYPAIQALLYYRVAHSLLLTGVPVLPRMLTEIAHSLTGIDINPGASIGEYFAIDHGTGVVIGETCIIGNHCTIYQGVTLGAKNFTIGNEGRPLNLPRHPILEDNVTVYSNASILGRITVGHDSVIGGNVWLTESVPPYSRILQHRG